MRAAEIPNGSTSQVLLVLLSPDLLATGFMQRPAFLARLQEQNDARPAVITALVRPVESTTHRTLNDSVALQRLVRSKRS